MELYLTRITQHLREHFFTVKLWVNLEKDFNVA